MVAVLVETRMSQAIMRGARPGGCRTLGASARVAGGIGDRSTTIGGFHDGTLLRRKRVPVARIRGDDQILAADIEGIEGDIAEGYGRRRRTNGSDRGSVIGCAIDCRNARYRQRQALR